MVELGEWEGRRRFEPRYDDPFFQSAFDELVELLAAQYDGHPQVEYVDTAMYGFWGEGHTWPLERNPFPDFATADNTFLRMLEQQLMSWKTRRLRPTPSPISAGWEMPRSWTARSAAATGCAPTRSSSRTSRSRP
jgi:hypothetical protein